MSNLLLRSVCVCVSLPVDGSVCVLRVHSFLFFLSLFVCLFVCLFLSVVSDWVSECLLLLTPVSWFNWGESRAGWMDEGSGWGGGWVGRGCTFRRQRECHSPSRKYWCRRQWAWEMPELPELDFRTSSAPPKRINQHVNMTLPIGVTGQPNVNHFLLVNKASSCARAHTHTHTHARAHRYKHAKLMKLRKWLERWRRAP